MRLSIISALLALAACAATDPWQGISPLDTDPDGLRAAIDLPPGLAVPENGVTLRMEARRDELDAELSGVFALIPGTEAERDIFRVADADLPAVRALQARIREWETTAPDETSGSYAISVAACPIGDGPGADAVMTVWITPGNGAPLTPVAQNVAVESAIGIAADKGICG
jgi:hypothetical protein